MFKAVLFLVMVYMLYLMIGGYMVIEKINSITQKKNLEIEMMMRDINR